MRMTNNTTTTRPVRYAIQLPNGSRLGRYTITGPIIPVSPAHAYTFTDIEEAKSHLEHARTTLGFSDADLVVLA